MGAPGTLYFILLLYTCWRGSAVPLWQQQKQCHYYSLKPVTDTAAGDRVERWRLSSGKFDFIRIKQLRYQFGKELCIL